MRTKYIFTSLTLAASLLFVSCKDDKANREPIDKDPLEKVLPPASSALIEVTQGETTASTCQLTFTPKDDKVKYVSLVMPKVLFNIISPQDLPAQALAQLKEEAKENNVSLGEYLSSIEFTGESTRVVSGLMSNTVYSVLTFERDGDLLKNTQLNDRFYFSTSIVDKTDLSFETSSSPDPRNNMNGVITIVPSDKDMEYYVFSMPKSEYDTMKEKNKFTDEQLFFLHFKNRLYRLLRTGSPDEMEAAKATLLLKGDHKVTVNAALPETEYIYVMASVVAIDPFSIAISSDLHKGTFISGKSSIGDETIDIEIYNLTQTHFGVRVTPSRDDLLYVWRQAALTDDLKDKTPEEIANGILSERLFGFFGDRNMGEKNHPKMPINSPGTDNYVIAFGFQGKTRTTKVFFKTFHTGTPADPSTTTFDIQTSELSTYSASLNFIPSDKRVHYAFSLKKDDETTLDEEKSLFQKDLELGYEGFKQANPSMDIEKYLDTYYNKNNTVFKFSDLEPSTSYTLRIYTISIENNKIANAVEHKSFLTTPALSTATITPELFGIFETNKIDTTMVEDIDKFPNKALIAVKYNLSDDAVEGRGFILPKTFREVELNPKKISDKQVQTKLKHYFHVAKSDDRKTLYSYYVCNWGEEQVVLAYAIDANGGTSPVLRKRLVTPTMDNVSDITRLQELIKFTDNKGGTEPSNELIVNHFNIFDTLKPTTKTSVVKKQNVSNSVREKHNYVYNPTEKASTTNKLQSTDDLKF